MEGNISQPGSFLEPNPEQIDFLNDQQNINAEDEFKTSEHNSETEENAKDVGATGQGQMIRGQPSNVDPLSGEGVQQSQDLGEMNVLSELRRDP